MSFSPLPQRSAQSWLLLGIVVSLVVYCGCGPRGPALAKVKGKALLNGKPLTKGSIGTLPVAGRGANGTIQPDGSFELNTFRKGDGALVGTHKVGVAAYEDVAGKGPEAGNGKLLVPQRYTNPETSKLTIEVSSSGENNPVLELTSP